MYCYISDLCLLPLKCMLWIPEDFVRSVACVCLFPFAGHIHKYNSLDGQPDILRSLYSALQPSSSTLEDRRYNCIRHRKCTEFFHVIWQVSIFEHLRNAKLTLSQHTQGMIYLCTLWLIFRHWKMLILNLHSHITIRIFWKWSSTHV